MQRRPLARLLLPLAWLAACAAQLDSKEGERCQIYDDEWGVCKPLNECDELLSSVQFEEPVLCSGGGRRTVVCCPGAAAPGAAAPPARPAVTIGSRIEGALRPPDAVRRTKSYQKCVEYAESVWVWKRQSSLPNEPAVRVSQCGFETKPLIVGGEPARAREFPHMAALGYGDPAAGPLSYECGGSLISERFVLTAAHCLYSRRAGTGPVRALLGLLRLSRPDELGSLQSMVVERAYRHQNYSVAKYHDIALLRLAADVRFTEFVRPACLHVEQAVDTRAAIATGWGLNSSDASAGTDDLMKVRLSLIDEQECRRAYRPSSRRVLADGVRYSGQLCAGDPDKDTCQGDSGGPLQIYRADVHCMYDVVGVTSFGIVCGQSPGVYTRVSHYVPWIESVVWPDGQGAAGAAGAPVR